MIGAVTGSSEFSTANNLMEIREGRRDEKKYGMTPTLPNSRDWSRTSKHPAALSFYASKTQVPS